MEKTENKMGLDRETFSSYVECLAARDKRIKGFEKVGIADSIMAYKLDIELSLGRHHKNLSFNLVLFEKDGLKMGIYHPLMKIPSNVDFKGKIEELNEWWKTKAPNSLFKVGETPDSLLVSFAQGPAATFPTEQTEWVSDLVYTSNLVSTKLREGFPQP